MDKAPSSSYIYIKLFIYFIFLFSGLIKWIPFPVDFTLFCGFFLVLFIINDFKKERFKLYNINIGYLYVVFYTFSILYMLTYFYSESTVYAFIKVRGFILNILAFTFPITSIKVQYYKQIIKVFSFLTLLVIGFFCFLLYNDLFDLVKMSDEDQLKFFFANLPSYLSYGSLLGVSYMLLINNKSIFSLLFKIVIFYFLIILGGRGPLLALILISMINFFINRNNLTTYFKYVFFFFFLVILYIYLDLTFIDFDRLNIFQNYSSDTATTERVYFIGRCIAGFFENPMLGHGIGSTGILISGDDIILYPHNLFIEVLSEFGLIGFILFLTIFVLFFIIIITKKVPIEYIPFLLVVAYLFLQDMKSGAFEAWRITCGWLSIATVILNFNSIKTIISDEANEIGEGQFEGIK